MTSLEYAKAPTKMKSRPRIAGGSSLFPTTGDQLWSPYAQKFCIDSLQQNCILTMGVDNFFFSGGHALTESFQSGDDPFKQPHNVCPGRPKYALLDKQDDLGHVFVSES